MADTRFRQISFFYGFGVHRTLSAPVAFSEGKTRNSPIISLKLMPPDKLLYVRISTLAVGFVCTDKPPVISKGGNLLHARCPIQKERM